MRYEVLNALMNTVSSYTPLSDYALANLGKDFTHIIGNGLRNKPAKSDFPFMSYVPYSEDISLETNRSYKASSRIYILYGIHESDITKATKYVLEVSELIKECLRQNYTLNGNVLIAYPVRFETDEGFFQPFYYARMLVEILEG